MPPTWCRAALSWENPDIVPARDDDLRGFVCPELPAFLCEAREEIEPTQRSAFARVTSRMASGLDVCLT